MIGRRSRGASGDLASSASIRSRSPTSTTVSSGWSPTASHAPATMGPGAKSPPIASKATRIDISRNVWIIDPYLEFMLCQNDVGMPESGRLPPFRIPRLALRAPAVDVRNDLIPELHWPLRFTPSLATRTDSRPISLTLEEPAWTCQAAQVGFRLRE